MSDTRQERAQAPISGIGFWFALWQAQFEAGLKFWASFAGMTPMSASEAAQRAESQRSDPTPGAAPESPATRKAG